MPDPSSWRIRPASPADAARCQAIAVRAWQPVHDSYAAILGAEFHDRLWPQWGQEKAAQVGWHLREHPGDAAVVEDGAALIGFVTWTCDAARGIGTIGNNAVEPDRQGEGIATALYGHALEEFRRRGLTVASVTTGLDEGHAAARRAYGKVGFRLGLPSVTYYQPLDAPLSNGFSKDHPRG